MDSAKQIASAKPRVIVIMGVAGSGKTTVGHQLAHELGWTFRDADEFHPPANVAKMSAGIPLNDEDRRPWLLAIREHILACLSQGRGTVVTCSALKQKYRDVIVAGHASQVKIVHLTGDFDLIADRMRLRQGHFMKPEMLRSQFEALEPPTDALQLDIKHPVPALVAAIRREFGL